MSGRAGVRRLVDGASSGFRLGADGQTIVQKSCGNYAETTFRGRVFEANIIYATIASAGSLFNNYALWNPPDSGVNVVPIQWSIGIARSATTSDPTVYGLYTASPFNLSIADVDPSSTKATPTSAYLKGLNVPTPGGAIVSPSQPAANVWSLIWSASTTATTPVLFRLFAAKTGGAANTVTQLPAFVIDFEGTCIAPPNTLLAVFRIGGLSGPTFGQIAVWEEIPIQSP